VRLFINRILLMKMIHIILKRYIIYKAQFQISKMRI